MRPRPIPVLGFLLVLLVPAAPLGAHGGGLASNGCHHDRKRGGYHCHRAAVEPDSAGAVRKSRAGICHDGDSPNYHQLRGHESFDDLRACIASGGRARR